MIAAVDEAMDLAHDERGLVVLVVALVADDRLARTLVGPEMLGPVRRVVLDHRVRGVEDALTRPVVLVEHDRDRFRKLLLELQQVPKVRPAELVDRVVGDDPVRDEVVRAIDVEVVHRLVERNHLDARNRIEHPVLIEHDHAGSHRRRGPRWQRDRDRRLERLHPRFRRFDGKTLRLTMLLGL